MLCLSRFRFGSKIGYLGRLERQYGYLSISKHFPIRCRTKELNSSHVPVQEHNWSRTVYGNVKEEIPRDIPKLLGNSVITTTFLDANLLHDIVAGKSVTAVLDCSNTTPIDWYLKRQATVETATYGSEFVAARTATKQTMDPRNMLRYLGVPTMTKAYMFGDNKYNITSTTMPQSVPQSERSHCHQEPRFLCKGQGYNKGII